MMEKMMKQMGKGKMPVAARPRRHAGRRCPAAAGGRGVAPLERRTAPKKRKGRRKRSGRR